jgi:hypothetical protein
MTSGKLTEVPRHPDSSRANALEVHYRADGDLCRGSVEDLGMGKLQLVGETHFPAGTELELRFGHSPSRIAGVVTMKASVQHSQAGKMAITFMSVRPSDHTKMLSTIRQLAATRRK